jgi:hypothetical protein
LKKIRRAEGGTNIFVVFCVKNHDFTPKNHISYNFRGGGGDGVPGAPPPLDPPLLNTGLTVYKRRLAIIYRPFSCSQRPLCYLASNLLILSVAEEG